MTRQSPVAPGANRVVLVGVFTNEKSSLGWAETETVERDGHERPPNMTTFTTLLAEAVGEASDKLALADAPNRTDFFRGEPQRLTWSEVARFVESLASALQAAGISKGDVVSIQLPNVVELPISILACAHLGAIATPFPIQHREYELREGLTVSGSRHLITAARPDRPNLLAESQVVLDEFGASMLTFEGGYSSSGGTASTELSVDVEASALPRLPAHEASADDVATICWTSGTTGLPKGVPRTHAMWMATSGTQVTQLELNADDRILCPFPLVNMAGIGGMLVPWLETSSTLFLHNPIDLGVFLGQISDEQITYTVAPPPLLNMLIRNETLLDNIDMSHVRKITSGSAPLDPWMVAGWQDRGLEIVNAFGSNEGAAMLSTFGNVPNPELRARFFPKPTYPGVEVRLVTLDTEEEITEPGVLGELRFRGPTVFSGYLESDGTEFDSDGFYRTGDIFQWATDDPNLLQFVDREKDIIIRGGMNVSAAEVEALISSHDTVAECSVVAYPDPDLGERVGVFVVAASEVEPTLTVIVKHLQAQNLASYKLPERLELLEGLPRNPVGKIVKGELRDLWSS